jgi:hypothetical protein
LWKQIDADYCLFICAIGDPIIEVANLDYRHGEWQTPPTAFNTDHIIG